MSAVYAKFKNNSVVNIVDEGLVYPNYVDLLYHYGVNFEITRMFDYGKMPNVGDTFRVVDSLIDFNSDIGYLYLIQDETEGDNFGKVYIIAEEGLTRGNAYWRPKDGEMYSYIGVRNGEPSIRTTVFSDEHFYDTLNCIIGNCYRTLDEAGADIEKWAIFFKENNQRIIDIAVDEQ